MGALRVPTFMLVTLATATLLTGCAQSETTASSTRVPTAPTSPSVLPRSGSSTAPSVDSARSTDDGKKTQTHSPQASTPGGPASPSPGGSSLAVQGCSILQHDFAAKGIAAALPYISQAASQDPAWKRAAADLQFLSGFSDATPATDERINRAAEVAGDCTRMAQVAVSSD